MVNNADNDLLHLLVACNSSAYLSFASIFSAHSWTTEDACMVKLVN